MSNSSNVGESWDVQQARNLYNVQRWGAGYFDINESGRVTAKPLQENGASVDITDVVEEAKARGLTLDDVRRAADGVERGIHRKGLAERVTRLEGRWRFLFGVPLK